MIDLYANDKTAVMMELLNKIKSTKSYDKTLQRDINTYYNLKDYHEHRNNDKIKEYVNSVLSPMLKFLESDLKDYEKKYYHTLFELMIAFFIFKNKIQLKEREKLEGLPDLEFQVEQQTYYLECATRVSSLADEYYKDLPNFPYFFKIATLFSNRCKELKLEGHLSELTRWNSLINKIWDELSQKDKNIICEILNNLGSEVYSVIHYKKIIERVYGWVYHLQYVYLYLEEILSEEVASSLHSLELTEKRIAEDGQHWFNFLNFLVGGIAQVIIDKLDREYFEKNLPVILAISIAPNRDFKMIKDPHIFLLEIGKLLSLKLMEVAEEKVKEKEKEEPYSNYRQMLNKNIKNLYAIIIDTTDLNWHLPTEVSLNYPQEFDNFFGIIYNDRFLDNGKEAEKIFKSKIPYSLKLCLRIS